MPTANFLFFLNGYDDLVSTTTPALNNFKWTREINGVPYVLENSQQIQVPASSVTPNIIPYPFSSPTNSGSYVLNGTTNISTTGSAANVVIGNLVVGSGIPVGTTVVSVAPTQYVFTVSAANATVGAVYSNNGQNFTVGSTIVSGTTLSCTGSVSQPQSSGVLALVSGTGDATITFSAFTQSTAMVISEAATSSGSSALNFYAPASFIYLEADQQVSVIYNSGSPMAINPFEINGILVPGVFFVNGPLFSLTVTNPGPVVANIFLACMG